MSAGMVGVLAVVVPLYARLASQVSRRRLINVVTAIFADCLVVFYALSQYGVQFGTVYFIWIGIFSVMLPAQLWAFANDLYTPGIPQRFADRSPASTTVAFVSLAFAAAFRIWSRRRVLSSVE